MNLLLLAIAVGAAIFSCAVLLLLPAADRSAKETRLMEISAIVASSNLKYGPRSLLDKLACRWPPCADG